MEITEVRIKLMEDSEDRLRAFCSITLDHSFVVRDLKIIDGINGPFVAMPSRKLTGHCHRCGHKNHLRAQFCNQCGVKLRSSSDPSTDSPQKLYADVAHPINSECREMIQNAVIDELHAELARAGQPGYRSRYDDEFDSSEDELEDAPESRGDSQRSESRPTPDSREGGAAKQDDSRTSGPPRPHFDQSARGQQISEPSDDREDSFGAGIFE